MDQVQQAYQHARETGQDQMSRGWGTQLHREVWPYDNHRMRYLAI